MQVTGRSVGGNFSISSNESIEKKEEFPDGETWVNLSWAWQQLPSPVLESQVGWMPSVDGQAWGHQDTAGRLRQHCLELVRQQTPMMERSFPPLGDPMVWGIFSKQSTRDLDLSGLHLVQGRAACLHPSPVDEPLK